MPYLRWDVANRGEWKSQGLTDDYRSVDHEIDSPATVRVTI